MNTQNDNKKILIIDDDQDSINIYSKVIKDISTDTIVFPKDESKVMTILDNGGVSMLILDIMKTSLPGIDFLTAVKLHSPDLPVVIITENANGRTAVECMKKSAFDYIVKPVNEESLKAKFSAALSLKANNLEHEIDTLRKEIEFLRNVKFGNTLQNKDAFSEIVTSSDSMFSIFSYCEAISKTHNSVLITGETGTGKELIAKALYKLNKRKGKFVACNVAGFDDQLISDALFGHLKGAYTGAMTDRKGLVDEAQGGTLFLDEIGDLSLNSQVKLLRLLQEKEYSPLGSDSIKKADIQVIVATNRNIHSLSDDNKFRRDLYYRLITHHIHLPPLREKKKDIPMLFEFFLADISKKLNKKPPSYHPSLLLTLQLYDYPGNIRELRSMIEDAVVNHESKILSSDVFRKHIERNANSARSAMNTSEDLEKMISSLKKLPGIKEFAGILVEEALKRANGNQSAAAKILKISHQALNKRLKEFNLT